MRNTRNLIKGPGVASVARFGWWTLSDVPKDLTCGVASVVSFGLWSASDVPKDLTFQLWLKITEKY